MKLFQRLLVAPAALSLMAPVVANANEVNLNEIANYSDIESIEPINSFDQDRTLSNLEMMQDQFIETVTSRTNFR